ncbi:hypothetical protein EVAR_34349_1 [Eumeta japonica]|uniref:Uncharacterized protein n=1 Tax=Eumeta variegata TaxID=151549 RepID=A0A4C1VEB8_EUMVA|nr:hypothetical protein EVAR_34349_1 [Eumeta japonica]
MDAQSRCDFNSLQVEFASIFRFLSRNFRCPRDWVDVPIDILVHIVVCYVVRSIVRRAEADRRRAEAEPRRAPGLSHSRAFLASQTEPEL